MNALIIFAHPEPSSFNAHWAKVTAREFEVQGMTILWSDLYKDEFDPVERGTHFKYRADLQRFDAQREQRHAYTTGSLPSDVATEIDKISKADIVVFHFPLWWFGMPAILKGWMDRVFVYGGMYKSSRRYDRGMCRGKKALFCVTAGASAQACSYRGYEGETSLILWPAMYPLRYLGFTVLQPFIIHGVHGNREAAEQAAYQHFLNTQLEKYRQVLRAFKTAPVIPYNCDADFDETGCLKPEAPTYSPFIRQTKR